MPELPEVEVVRAGLEPFVAGRTFQRVEVLHPRANRGQDAPLPVLLEGRTVAGTGRRGKFMWLEFADGDDILLIHLGMSGQLRIGHTDSKHVRIKSHFDDGTVLSFVDQRTFGYWRVQGMNDIAHIAPDPLGQDFVIDDVIAKLQRKTVAIKVALLDQSVASGIGNIYADEALWAARIHPLRPARSLTETEIRALYQAAADVMRAALKVGGTSFDALYVNVNGESGYFARSLHAYAQTGQPCARCGTAMEKMVIGGRSSHVCPTCQQLHPA